MDLLHVLEHLLWCEQDADAVDPVSYTHLSSFSNQDEGGVIVFGLDEKQGFQKVGVYDAQDLQKKLMEVGEEMTPVVPRCYPSLMKMGWCLSQRRFPRWISRTVPASKQPEDG